MIEKLIRIVNQEIDYINSESFKFPDIFLKNIYHAQIEVLEFILVLIKNQESKSFPFKRIENELKGLKILFDNEILKEDTPEKAIIWQAKIEELQLIIEYMQKIHIENQDNTE
ncbi:MAG: hypothetical protein WC002_07465 [Candidatus Muiribacteriota bacterium]